MKLSGAPSGDKRQRPGPPRHVLTGVSLARCGTEHQAPSDPFAAGALAGLPANNHSSLVSAFTSAIVDHSRCHLQRLAEVASIQTFSIVHCFRLSFILCSGTRRPWIILLPYLGPPSPQSNERPRKHVVVYCSLLSGSSEGS